MRNSRDMMSIVARGNKILSFLTVPIIPYRLQTVTELLRGENFRTPISNSEKPKRPLKNVSILKHWLVYPTHFSKFRPKCFRRVFWPVLANIKKNGSAPKVKPYPTYEHVLVKSSKSSLNHGSIVLHVYYDSKSTPAAVQVAWCNDSVMLLNVTS